MGWPRDGLAIIIPARLESSRLPRKLLIEIHGRTVLEWTWRRARASGVARHVAIATDSAEITAAARAFGADVIATGPQPTGTHRVAQAAGRLAPPPRWVIDLQGDEPRIDPQAIIRVAERLCGAGAGEAGTSDDAAIVTAAAPLASLAEWRDAGVVKVVCRPSGEALYFSRAPVPGTPSAAEEGAFARVRGLALQHVGIYGYPAALLQRFVKLAPSPLAEIESLEQLRALEAGIPIRVVRLERAAPSLDTPADLERLRRMPVGGEGDEIPAQGGGQA